MWKITDYNSLDDATCSLAAEKELSEDIQVEPHIVGFTDRQVNNLTLKEFKERQGFIFLRPLSLVHNEASVLLIAERLNFWCNYALSEAEADPDEDLQGDSKKIIMRSEAFKKVFERSSRSHCPGFLQGRKDIQNVRGRRVHPSHMVTKSLPPSIPQEEFTAVVPPRCRNAVSFMYHLILREDDPVLILAKEFERTRRSEDQDDWHPHDTAPVRISSAELLMCS